MFARMVSIGLAIGVCFALVKAAVPGEAPVIVTVGASAQTPLTVVDVSRAATSPADLAHALRLGADEQVIAVNDRSVRDSLAAGAAISDAARTSGHYLDLTVRGTRGERRLLVLVH